MEIPGGARKLGIYSLLILLAVLICINLGLTLWMLSTLHLHWDGTGPVQFVKNGLKIDEATYVMNTLNTAEVIKLISRKLKKIC